MPAIFHRIAKYFIEGLLIIMPFGLTAFVLVYGFYKLQSTIHSIIIHIPLLSKSVEIPGLSLLISCIAVCFLGYLASNFVVHTILSLLEWLIMRIPIANIIYSYIKESTSAFVDKFEKPVLVTVNKALRIQRLGFITQESMTTLELEDKVVVYIPHSYSFSGELHIVPQSQVTTLNISSTEVLRFILSGGLSEIKQPLTLQE